MDEDRCHQALGYLTTQILAALDRGETPDEATMIDLAQHYSALDEVIRSTGRVPGPWYEPVRRLVERALLEEQRRHALEARLRRAGKRASNDGQLLLFTG